MENYKSNSYKSKDEETATEKKVTQVANGKQKKKSTARKFSDLFVSDDTTKVKEYILMDVIVPAIKKAISDTVTTGIDMILYGDSGRSRNNSASSKVSYRSYYDRTDRDRTSDRSGARRAPYEYDDVYLSSRAEAEEVIQQMEDLIDSYKEASVADLYDLVGINGNYTDNKYGWTNLKNAFPKRVGDEYLLVLPKAIPLDH